MQQPLGDGGWCSPSDLWDAPEGCSSSEPEVTSRTAVQRGRTEAGNCHSVLVIHGTSSRRGGAHLNEDRLSIAQWPVSGAFPEGSSSISSSSISLRQDSLEWWGGSGSSSPSSLPSSSVSCVTSPQWSGSIDAPQVQVGAFVLPPTSPPVGSAAEKFSPAAAAAAAKFPEAETMGALDTPAPSADGFSGPARVCLRRPGVFPVLFSLESSEEQPLEQQPASAFPPGSAAGGFAGCCRGVSACCRLTEEAAVASEAAAEEQTGVSEGGPPGPAGAPPALEPPVMSVDAALAALVEGRLSLPSRQQQQRRLSHAAAPCEGWGVSVSAACSRHGDSPAAAASEEDADATSEILEAQGSLEGTAVRACGEARELQKQSAARPSSFLMSVFDGHDSDVASEFASLALPLLAAKRLPPHITSGQEQEVAAAAAAVFAALDEAFRKRCTAIENVSGTACTSGCCAISAFIQGPHLFVFNLGDCRCAFLALGDINEPDALPASADAAEEQKGFSDLPKHSTPGSSSRNTGHREIMLTVCRSSPSLRAALRRAGAGVSAASPQDEGETQTPVVVTWEQKPYSQVLPPPQADPFAAPPQSPSLALESSRLLQLASKSAAGELGGKKPGITFHWLSRDLRASAPYELQRLRSLNATVEGGRLGGILEPSRTVGDFDIKDSQPKGALSAQPEVAYLHLTTPGLLLLASDGFWDFVGPGEILKCLQQVQGVWRPIVKIEMAGATSCTEAFPYVPTAAALSRLGDKLLRRAKRLGSDDDTTCVVVFLKPLSHEECPLFSPAAEQFELQKLPNEPEDMGCVYTV
ncbi:uncharacterized protein LOC34624638 [Cyclospora cayetanensis]|uniref:Uncharacterized protein LOC34624638 n=1 Tax=Cyclospora cayetanensis TaxID=88456 RepID=A0A6P6RSM4_9EIME|nr:uncharacterized protein LOC34624638 [Cyclospora cayetanensis]